MSDISDISLSLVKKLSDLSNRHSDLTLPQLAVDLSALPPVVEDLTKTTPVDRKNTLRKLQSDCTTKIDNFMKKISTPENKVEFKVVPSSSDSLVTQKTSVSVDRTALVNFLKQIPNKKFDNFSIPFKPGCFLF